MMIAKLITLLALVTIATSIVGLTLSISDQTVNALADYTWQLTFSAATPRTFLTLTFPSPIAMTATTQFKYNNINNLTPNSGNTSLTATLTPTATSIFTGIIAIVVTNVRNPSSGVTRTAFQLATNLQSFTGLSVAEQITFSAGTFAACPFTFNLCTEQANSELTVAVSLVNSLITTNSRFVISYPFVWPGLSKGLGTDTTSLSVCSFSIDGGTTFSSSAVSCSIEKVTANQITVFFQIDLNIAVAGKALFFKIGGVNAPPTQTTSGGSLRVTTTDDSGNEIDSKSGCAINPVCITNLTNGQLTTTGLQVNSPYNRPDIKHNSYPLITVIGGDTMDVYYSPFSDLVGCNTFKYWRVPTGLSGMMTTTIVATSTNFYNFTIQPAAYLNSDSSNPIFVSIQCTSFKMPVSETPVNMTFRFRRAGIQYLELNTTIQAVAIESNFTQAILFVNQLEMGLIASYQFTIKLGQPLGTNPRIVFSFPTDIGISGAACTVSLSSAVSATIASISIDTVANTLGLLLTAGSALVESTNITITVNGIINAKVPTIYYIGYTTYYDSLTTSRVQYNTSAFNSTFTAVTTTLVTLLPSSMTVYTLTPTTISFTNTINLPASSIFLLQFPTSVSLLQVSATPLTVNGVNVTLSGAPSTTSNTLAFTISQAIPISNPIIISLSVRTPTIMSNYSFVKLTISSGGVNYLLSQNTMQLVVDKVASQALTLVPQLSKAGASSAYLFTLTLSVPHPGTFTVYIQVPSDVGMTASAAICSVNCSGSVLPVSKTFSFTVNNGNPNSATPVNVNFLVSNFTNPRSTGTALSWTLTTLDSLGGNIISKQSASPFISLPNFITTSLSLNDEYYRSNINSVKIRMTFFNPLISTDYILLTMDTTTYTENTVVNCSNSLGICSKHPNSTTGLLIVQVVPVLTQIINGTFDLVLQGLISGANTGYMQTDFITARTYTAGGLMIDNGTMPYNISCRESAILSKSCRRCSNTSCYDCYVVNGYYLNGTTCVTSCGDATKFMSYANVTNGTCQTCINNCATCTSSTVCVTCLNTSSFYLYTNDFTCKLMCLNNSGFVTSTLDSRPICSPCFDYPYCLECSSTASGACSKCSNNSFLLQGSCLTNCSSPMLYNSNGLCLPCNTSCATCSGPGNTACILCAVGYVNSSGKCQPSCDSGRSVIPSTNQCGCDLTCTFCQTANYYACTVCATFGQFVWQGKCITTCPSATYNTSTSCISCSIGCANCSSTTCSLCEIGWILYNNYCVTDCNLISQQYDQQGSTCVLCPDGCDSCSGVTCKSCLSGYSLSGSQCIKTCLLYNNCDLSNSQVLPLPGFICLVLWTAIVLIIRFISHKNYVPYSIILFSCVIQFILVIALLGVTDSTAIARLLAGFSYAYRNTMKVLLILSIVFNYLSNAAYIFIFVRYIRPLMNNPKQIDFIANVVVLVVAGLTNYRFALIAFARMFPKPSIYIQNASKLTPVHYLCICSIILDLFSIVAGGLGVYNEQPKTDMFMLSLDLLMIIAVNIAISIWFVSSTKSEDYFEDDLKKYHIEEHNVTGDTLPNEKNNSKANMIANQSINFYDDDFVEHPQKTPEKGDSYKKIRAEQIKVQQKEQIIDIKGSEIRKSGKNSSEGLNSSRLPRKIIREEPTKDVPKNINLKNSQISKPERFDPESDVNFQQNLKPRKGMSSSAQKMNMSPTLNTESKKRQNSPSSKGKSIPISMKQSIRSDRKKQEPNREIEQVIQESDIPDMQQNSEKDGRESVFENKQKLIRPKRVGTQKSLANTKKKQLGKSLEDPKKMMKKEKRVGYFESDAFESNAEVEDLEAIIKQKVFQSTMKLEKPRELSHESNEQTGYEEISPSWYNVQNQRLDISDMDDAESQP